ncbi:Tetraspanin-31-B, partial [Nibea albiflora]
QETLLKSAWAILENNTKIDLEDQLNCCGLVNSTETRQQFDQDLLHCTAVCYPCGELMLTHATEALKILGGVGLFFSFTERLLCLHSSGSGTTQALLPVSIPRKPPLLPRGVNTNTPLVGSELSPGSLANKPS